MIVSEKEVEAALEFKGDSDRAAEVTYKHEMAEIEADEALDRAYLGINDDLTVREKEARARLDLTYMRTRRDAAAAKRELVRYKTYLDKANALIDVWRSEGANARGMEMVR